MLRISRLADYSTVVMAFFATHPKSRFSAAAVAEATCIALPTVSKILKFLNEANLLISTRGVNGGYQLARDAEQITVVDVISVIDGKPAVTQCGQGDAICVHDRICQLRGNWQFLNRMIVNVLKSVSIADMIQPLAQKISDEVL